MAAKSATSTARSLTTEPAESGALVMKEDLGNTTIRPHVVAKIAGLAIREVAGVHGLVPFGTGQAITNLARSVTGAEHRDLGVSVEVGLVEAAVDARIVSDYGASIPRIATDVRRNVAQRIEEMTGLKLKELNLEIVDLWFDDEEAPASVRVQ